MTSKIVLKQKAASFLSLHTGGKLLVLPNVWDPLGARILEAKGYPAVATAGAAISASLGFKDGERIRRSTLIEVIGRIAASVAIPVTADIDAGHGKTISDLEETIRAVIDAGVVGINIEDGIEDGRALRPVAEQCERISAVRECAAREGVHLVINARIDSFHVSSVFSNIADAREDAVARAAAYAQAGADCVFPVGPGDAETAKVLRSRIDSPINIIWTPKAAPPAELESIGVNRLSFGPFIHRALMRKFVDIADALMTHQDPSGVKDMLSKSDTDAFLRDGPE